MNKNLKLIKKAIAEVKDEKELFESIAWIVDRINDAYYDLDEDEINFNKPAKIVSIDEDEELVIYENEIMRSSMLCENYSRYEKNGKIYAFKSNKFSSNIKEQLEEPLLKFFEYNYIDSFTFVYKAFRPISSLKFFPKNKDEAKKHILSLEQHKVFGGTIWHDINSDKKFPSALLTYSGVNYYRTSIDEDYTIHSNTMILPKMNDLNRSAEPYLTLFKTHYKLFKRAFNRPDDCCASKGITINSSGNEQAEDEIILAHHVSKQKMVNERKRFESICNQLKDKYNIKDN